MSYTEHKSETRILSQPEYKWAVYPFGKECDLSVHLTQRPRLWSRIWMRLFFGWKFEKENEND